MPKAHGRKSSRLLLVAAMLVVGAVGFAPAAAWAAACEPTDKIDGSTVDTARQKIEEAGYRQVRNLKKGGGNFWHGKAVDIVLSPQGSVMVEGD